METYNSIRQFYRLNGLTIQSHLNGRINSITLTPKQHSPMVSCSKTNPQYLNTSWPQSFINVVSIVSSYYFSWKVKINLGESKLVIFNTQEFNIFELPYWFLSLKIVHIKKVSEHLRDKVCCSFVTSTYTYLVNFG